MTVQSFNYSNCNSDGIDSIIDNSVCTEIFTYSILVLYPLTTMYNYLLLSPEMMNIMLFRIVVVSITL